MDLIAKSLDIILHSKVLLKGFDIVGVLVSRREDANGDFDVFGVLGIDHGRMRLCGDDEGGSISGGEGYDLTFSRYLISTTQPPHNPTI